jgi:hypothetical protein
MPDFSSVGRVIQGLDLNITSKTASYTATVFDDVILCAPAADMTISLPIAAGYAGKVYTIQKTNSNAFTVIIDPNGSEQINGATTFVLTAQYQTVTVTCDGTAWYTTNYSTERRGKATTAGNGSTTVFNIPHGLGVIPHDVIVSCRTHILALYTADITNIVCTITPAPANAAPVIFDWSAVV